MATARVTAAFLLLLCAAAATTGGNDAAAPLLATAGGRGQAPPGPWRCTNGSHATGALRPGQGAPSCSFAGVCKADGRCRCAGGFAGADCSALNVAPRAAIAPGRPRPGHGYNTTGYSETHAWCGSLLQDRSTGLWHLYFTAMLHNCPVVYTFYQNGVVLHATADSPFGPFLNPAVALGNWATQPEVHVDNSTGTPLYVLMHSRFAPWSARTHGNATTFPCDVDGRIAPPPARDHAMERNVSFAFGPSPAGPWECCTDVQLDSVMKNPSVCVGHV